MAIHCLVHVLCIVRTNQIAELSYVMLMKEATQTHSRDGEGLGMRVHTHTLEMVKVWE